MEKIKSFFKKNKEINLFNPYFLFSFIFSAVLLVYQLNWSQLTISISWQLLLFLIVNILLFLFLGYRFDKQKIENTDKIYTYKNSYMYVSIFIIIGILIEGIFFKGYPLFNSFGGGNIKYIDYGIPMFHVLLLTVSYFFFLILFESIIHNRKERKSYFSLIISLIPFVVTINRGMIVMLVLSCICLYAQYNRIVIRKKLVFMLAISVLLFFYLFGLFGNYRINSDHKEQRNITDSTIIMDVGGASSSFRESYIPKPFLDVYIRNVTIIKFTI